MAHVFKHKQSGLLYTLSHLVKDIRFLNGGAFEGIYAKPFRHKGPYYAHTRQMQRYKEIPFFNPKKFVEENFEIVAELW